MTRRQLLALSLSLPFLTSRTLGQIGGGVTKLHSITRIAKEKGWSSLPIGEVMGKVGQQFLGTPYVAGTLEGPGEERCRIDLEGLDCVTYYEVVLALARLIKKGDVHMEALRKEITFLRYRDGEIDGYTSRLHYTSDWIADNVAKRTITDITETILDGVPLEQKVDFMSTHPQYYKPLSDSASLISKIKEVEADINGRERWYVPKVSISTIESELRTGDIVAVATSKKGLDYAHTGMILRKDGEARFMHASTTKKQVVIDVTISAYVASVASHIGITVIRPNEPL
jgi:hypothetical protein